MTNNTDIDKKDVEVPELGNLSVPGEFDLEKAKGAKYDSLDEFVEAHKSVSFWTKIKHTWQGKTDVGRIIGTGLDIAELFAPKWAVKTRTVIQSKTTTDMNIIKKALSIQGAKDFLKWKDEDGNFSWEQVGVSLLQIGIVVLLAWLDSQFGLGLIKMLTGS